MKKFFITLIAFCGLALQANADVTVYVGSKTLTAGEEGSVSFWLESDQEVAAFSAVVALPAGITFTSDLELTAAGEAIKGDGGLGGGSIDAGTKMNLVAYGLEPCSGKILFGTAPVEVADGVELTDFNIVITTLKVEYQDATQVVIDAPETMGEDVITVSDKYILDENAKALPSYRDAGDITVKRTIKAGEWSTLCLPFEIDPEDLADAIGGDVEVAEFTGNEVDGDGNMVVSFDVTDYIEANYPYIIKTSVDVTEFDLEDIEVDPSEADAVAENASGKGQKRVVDGVFVGTLHAGSPIPLTVSLQNAKDYVDGATVFVSGNKFFYTSDKTQAIKAFRGYFAFSEDVRDAGVKFFVNGEATRINEVQNNVTKSGAIYDLSGKQVRNINNLKGVFIQDGKKVVK